MYVKLEKMIYYKILQGKRPLQLEIAPFPQNYDTRLCQYVTVPANYFLQELALWHYMWVQIYEILGELVQFFFFSEIF
jgi:hypothetical protein